MGRVGIEPTTFWFEAKCAIHCATRALLILSFLDLPYSFVSLLAFFIPFLFVCSLLHSFV